MLDQVAELGRWTQQHPEIVLGSTGALAAVAMGAALLRGQYGREQTTHGSARWATKKEVQKAGLYAHQGTVLGRFHGRILRHDGPEHILLCGPTRSGKGVGIIVPTLLDWPESVLVLDPKDGENYDLTARWRQQHSQVVAFTPCRQPNACINVLDTIRLGTPQAISDAQLIAQSLTAPSKFQMESGTGAHFRELATMLLTAAILHQCCVGARPSLAGVWEFLTQQHEHLGEALQTMIETAYEDPDTEAGIVGITRAIQNISGDRELSSVWTTAIRPLVLYSDPLVAASTDTSTFRLEDLQYGTRPVSLYLIAPSPMTLERLHPVYRVILDVTMARLMDHKVRTWKWRLLNCLDELPWYGYCRAIDKGIAVQAGYGQKNLVVTQDLSSLLEVYGQHTAIFGNCHVKVFHTPDNDLTAKRISENLLGPATVEGTGSSTTQGQSMSHSVNTHTVRRPLLTTDEVMDLPAHLEIIRVSGCKPILAEKLDYRQEREWQGRWPAPAGGRGNRKEQRMHTMTRRLVWSGALVGTAVLATTAQAGGLGIPMDGFITRFTDTVVGLGYPIGLLGLAGWAGAHLNNTFGALIGGSINLFSTAGLLGGGAAIMGTLGLAAGGLLP